MIGGAGAAEATPSICDGTVEEKEGSGVVIPGNSRRGHFRKGVARRVEQFGRVLGGSIREWNRRNLTAGDEDGAVGQDDGIGKGALVVHGTNGLNGGRSGRSAYRDDVGVGGRDGVLVVW